MFYWKSAIVLLGLLTLATIVILENTRANWERAAIGRLYVVAALITCVSLSFFSLMLSQLLFGLLLLMCVDRRVPLSGIYVFLVIWTLSAAPHLEIAGAYFAPVRPMLTLSFAMLIAYMLNPELRLERRVNRSDVYFIAFLLTFWVCVSLRDTATTVGRNFVNYVAAYALSYFIASRTRIERPELWLRLLVYAGVATGAVCIFELVRGWPLYSNIGPLKGLFMMVDHYDSMLERSGLVRATGPFVHPLAASVVLAMIAIAVYALLLIHGMRTSLILVGLIVVGGMLATVSRSGVAGFIAGITLMQLLRKRYGVMVVLLALGMLGYAALSSFSGSDGASTSAYRSSLLIGIPMKLGTRLIFGYREAIGAGLLDDFMQGQGIVDLVNVYLGIAVLGGVVSLVPFLLFIGSTFGIYRRIARMTPSREQLIVAQTCVCMQFAYLVTGMSIGAWGTPMLMSVLCVAVLVALRAEIERAARGRRHAAALPIAPTIVSDPFVLPTVR